MLIPDGMSEADAIRRTTHLGIGAHQDDLEFMALHGILACYRKNTSWFSGVTMTNGGGSSRSGLYANYTDEDMVAARREEQDHAARIGQYSFMAQLNYPSAALKDPGDERAEADLASLIAEARPDVIYTHNLADKHDTHVGVALKVLQAVRRLPAELRPQKVLGCEVWRGLDWMQDNEKVVLNVSGHENLAAALSGVFDSQIAGGKRYDRAVTGRRWSNATFFESHASDSLEEAWFAMDMTPLALDDTRDVESYVLESIERFSADVKSRIRKCKGGSVE